MSIFNILLSIAPPHEDFSVFGIPLTVKVIIYTTFSLIVPFYYGLFISNNKQYYMSILFFLFSLFSTLYYVSYMRALTETDNFLFVPISEFHERAISIPLELPLYIIYSFCLGTLIKWALKKYKDNQLRIILGLVAYSFLLLICGYLISIMIVSVSDFVVNAIEQFKTTNTDIELKPGQNAPVSVPAVETWAFAREVLQQYTKISLHSLYFLISGLIWSAYIYRKSRKDRQSSGTIHSLGKTNE